MSHDPEYQGPWWSHPYTLYLWGTLALFLFLGVMAWIAHQNGWIPNRGI